MNTFPKLHEDTERAEYSTHAQHFTSPQQYTQQAHRLFTKTAPADMLARRGGSNEYYANQCDFNGHISGYEQRDAVYKRECSATVRERVHAATLDIQTAQTGTQEQDNLDMYHDDSGLFLDSTAYFNGDEFNMINIDFVPQTKPIVYLAASIMASSQWKNAMFENRGIALIRAVHALEKQGFSVGVLGYGVAMVSDTDRARKECKMQRVINTIIVKAPEQALDESDLINTMTNAGMARNAGFQNFYYALGEFSASLGRPSTLTREDLKHSGLGDISLAVLKYDNSENSYYNSIEGALSLLRGELEKQAAIII